VATALLDKGAALSTAGQREAAAAAYAEVARRFTDDAGAEIRALVDRARVAADEPDAAGETG
jgi:hypothetical protein